ncbi:gliding motility-associated-like protein [Flavobacterium sp. PL11]|uniref:T9SS type B sorting domain-containing protein n=1 Tax=Flavobacterium sp. PL11 TaxID=3071717 RepID=UPI002E025151|nr:gliding motility-associated-like protein [Flavobacterium sp. PL11]
MKKAVVYIFFIFFYNGYSQALTVDTTIYTADELINKVLVNSPCVQGKNVKSRTGTNYGSSNGIGYFERTTTNFPFASGVVLSTGDVTRSPGPNINVLSDGISAWLGDTDLENVLLAQNNISINSINASYIEFDFQPKTPNFNFNFIFASEEYGTSQCDFSDAFAFLLKDLTASSSNKNLAVIPFTSIPVSVATIRDDTYNRDCPSANQNYFGSFNGSGFGPAINFNGQTVAMVASANNLDINHVYRIKIVIADGGGNTKNDSAIFLEANSLNIGQYILGQDYSAENGTAICPGSTLPILSATGLSPGTTFVWKKQGVAFTPAQTSETLNLNTIVPLISSGVNKFSVTYKEPDCIEVTDEIIVEIYPKIRVLNTVPNIYACNSEESTYKFDLDKNTKIIKAGINQATTPSGILDDLPSTTIITYHFTDSDAKDNYNALPNELIISNTESNKQIFVRIENTITSCSEIKSFRLIIVNAPVIATVPEDIILCARNLTDSPLRANFILTSQIAAVLGSSSSTYNKISFHPSEIAANNNSNTINLSSGNRLLSPSATLWVRVQNVSNTECYIITKINLIVTPIPKVDILPDVYACTSYKLPQLINLGSEYRTLPDGAGIIIAEGALISESKTLYIYNKSGVCTNQDAFKVTIIDLDSITPSSGSYCTQYELPALPYGNYYTQSEGTSTPGNVQLNSGDKMTTAGLNTIYVWTEDKTVTPSCQQEKQFNITIIPFVDLPSYSNEFRCTSYTVPQDDNGGTYYTESNKNGRKILPGESISTTTLIYVYKESNTPLINCISEKSFKVFIGLASIMPPENKDSCSAYRLPVLTVGEYRTAPSGGGISVPAGRLINTTTTLWFYVSGEYCTNNLNFTITVKIPPLPEMLDTEPQCDVYYLPPVDHSGNYFTGPLGTGQLREVGFPITSTQKIYFFDKFATGTCYVEEDFIITINQSPPIDARPIEVVQCGQSYVLDDLINGEYYEFSGGPSPTNPILIPGTIINSSKTIYVYAKADDPNNCISEYSIDVSITLVNDIEDKYACNNFVLPPIVGMGTYYTAPNGPDGTGTPLSPYSLISSTTTLYVYYSNNNRLSCVDEDEFTITIYNSPVIPDIAPVTRCEYYTLPPYLFPVNQYFVNQGGPSVINTERFPGDLITTSTTIYAYAETGTNSTVICPIEKPILITILNKPQPILNVPAICVDIITGIKTAALININFPTPKYAIEWNSEDGTLLSTDENFSTFIAGDYTLTITDLSVSGCSSTTRFTIIESAIPKSVTYTSSNWFTDQQTITVNAVPFVGNGTNFLYSLDGGTPQVSNIFTNISSGIHDIIVSDSNCGTITIPLTIQLIYSPKFFTPNDDGLNDTWNISGLPFIQNLKVYIYDRYGKLLKEIRPNDKRGWDGTLNGIPLPADDYWFTITYTEDDVNKEYKSHFSLKR